ncbi:hypothetical protein [Sphingobacterium sp. 1.A.4]|uniref:hypothetical protein n=1 Tax=Sphingobacterium sp. 1.A.4 TaxID=2044603 RepID=UPI0011819EB9|nr:hypothetical protein [Sphingobacterium sp. 1.A.4]
MKRLILSMMVCTLINGCGLFKNTSKDLNVVKSGAEVEKRNDTKLEYQDNSQSLNVHTSVRTSDKIKNTTLQADRVNFNSDGSFTAEGNVKLDIEESEKLRQLDSAFKKLQSDISYYLSSKETLESKQNNYEKDLHKESKTSVKGIIAGGIAFLIILIGVAWWFFGFKRNKGNAQKS